MFTIVNISFIYLFLLSTICCSEFQQCSIDGSNESETCGEKYLSNKRYILYDVNPPEGFNLRRDVYVRVSTFVKHLVETEKEFQWILVLPPWGPIYHWQSTDIGSQKQLPWGLFFDIISLQKFVPVIEMYQFSQEYSTENGRTIIDKTYILQNDEEMFKTGKFKDKNEVVECLPNKIMSYRQFENKYFGNFWGYNNISSNLLSCVTFHGTMFRIKKNLQPHKYRSIKFDHMEIPLHEFYGDVNYWTARRSMRYNKKLYEIADKFREKYLKSTNEKDQTERPEDWTKEKGKRNALGGPYISIHLRRKDFLHSHRRSVPSIKNVATQIKNKLEELKLNIVFVASDTSDEEYAKLERYISNFTVLRYIPTKHVKNTFKDGGIAIIDQILCSYGRYFMGTKESTFTFRIQEDREIIGFPADTTFNFLCANSEKCASTGRWEIVW